MRTSGTSEISRVSVIPKVLAYPPLLPLALAPAIKGVLCYVIRHYGTEGLSVLIYRQPKNDQVTVVCGDWKGNNIDLTASQDDRLVRVANHFVRSNDLMLFLGVMQAIRIEQAQFFFALGDGDELTLVDLQISLDKLASPGMLRDIFGRIYRTQEVLKVEVVDDRVLEYIDKGTGTYDGDLILKPSRFRMHKLPDTEKLVPLYVEVRR